jgi:hypothetical protein
VGKRFSVSFSTGPEAYPFYRVIATGYVPGVKVTGACLKHHSYLVPRLKEK